jgi:hypothetical protein
MTGGVDAAATHDQSIDLQERTASPFLDTRHGSLVFVSASGVPTPRGAVWPDKVSHLLSPPGFCMANGDMRGF